MVISSLNNLKKYRTKGHEQVFYKQGYKTAFEKKRKGKNCLICKEPFKSSNGSKRHKWTLQQETCVHEEKKFEKDGIKAKN